MKKYSQYFLIPLFAVVGALVFLNLFAHLEFRVEALHVRMAINTSFKGYTVFKVPPLGEIKAKTHKMPLSITISLENIDLDGLKKMLAEGQEQNKLVRKAKLILISELKEFILIILGISFAGGAFSVLVLQRSSLKELLAGGLIGVAVVSVLLLGTYRTFEIYRFSNPEYEGMIKAAPWMIGLVEESFSTVNTWGKEMRGIANNLYGLFRRVESLQAVSSGDGEVKVLHVTDIHNNPAAFDFIDQVVKTFGVDFVIDSGDMSDLGTPLESVMLRRVQNLRVPYLFTPGNHETPQIIKELKKIPNVTVLENGIKNIQGMKVAGISDPSSQTYDFHAPVRAKIDQAAEKLRMTITKSGIRPDIVVAHNPSIATKFWGQIPMVLIGHDHRYRIEVKPNSVLIDAGTSGASGIGAFRFSTEIQYSFVLLHFDRTKNGMRLKYTDTIRISNLQSGYSIERRVYPGMSGKASGI